ncbi:hypothetical protein BJ166DRAFT_115451 [Pestalotiopsis sp. NC0098]|nr:hypothetical protein BJ166DRAFT_115451 [Pestalotiopsis sp. NC0098]
MCTYYYLHYHHVQPCMRDIEYSLQYVFCENATYVPSIPSPSSPPTKRKTGSSHSGSGRSGRASSSSTSGSRSSNAASSSSSSSAAQQSPDYVQQPCAALIYAPEYNMADGSMIDYANPCATGGCLVSPGCTAGSCRLEDLGGRWICCQCFRGGNTFRWCAHPMKKVPDTMCYHVVCEHCCADS